MMLIYEEMHVNTYDRQCTHIKGSLMSQYLRPPHLVPFFALRLNQTVPGKVYENLSDVKWSGNLSSREVPSPPLMHQTLP